MKRCRPALGTYVEIQVPAVASDESGPDRRSAIDAAYAAIDRVDQKMSFHRLDSDLARINRAPHGATLNVDPWTVETLQLAADLERLTDGLFDCAVGAELIAFGLLPGHTGAHGSGTLASVNVLDETHVRVEASVCLDLGGLAKGHAVDRAIGVLRAHGVRQATVNAGGDLRVLGPAPQPISVRSPSEPAKVIALGTLADGAIATSSVAYTGGRDAAGRRRSALMNPRTREPVVALRSYSILADRCAIADGLTKVIAAMGTGDHPSLRHYGATALIL